MCDFLKIDFTMLLQNTKNLTFLLQIVYNSVVRWDYRLFMNFGEHFVCDLDSVCQTTDYWTIIELSGEEKHQK